MDDTIFDLFPSKPRSYRVVVRGVPVETDDLDDALALVRRVLAADGEGAIHLSPSKPHGWGPPTTARFMHEISQNPVERQVLSAVYEALDGLSKDALLARVKLTDGRQLGGAICSLMKAAKRIGCVPPISMKVVRTNQGRDVQYALEPSLRACILNQERKGR